MIETSDTTDTEFRMCIKDKLISIKYELICIVVIFAVGFIISLLYNTEVYYYDSFYYWTISDNVFSNGFDILNFPETYRGYFFVVLIGVFKKIFSRAWSVLTNIILAYMFGHVLPYYLRKKRISNATEMIRTWISIIPVFLIWGNFLQYPLSDFASSVFMMGGVVLLQKIVDSDLSCKSVIRSLVAGMLLYAAYNTRAAYLYAVCFALLLYVIFGWKKKLGFVVQMVAIILGIFVIALPQSLINYRYLGDCSPKVHTEAYLDYQSSLQVQQLIWGIEYPRYETYTGDDNIYPFGGVYFLDPSGMEIIEHNPIEYNIKYIIKLIIKYPLDMVGIYGRHLISLLTPTFSQVYITDIFNNKIVIILGSIAIWLIAGINIISDYKNAIFNRQFLWGFSVAIPCILQLLGAVEIRFFLPIYMIAYFYVFACIDYRKLWEYVRPQFLKHLVLFLTIMILWISVIGSILSNNAEDVMLINDSDHISYVESQIQQ